MSIHESCEAIEPLLAPYDEPGCSGVLSDAERTRVETHLAQCGPCRDMVQACAAARQALRAHAGDIAAPAPELLSARCRALALRAGTPHRARRWVGLSVAAATAAVLLFTFISPTQAVATQLALDHVKCTKLGLGARTGTPADLEAFWRNARGKAIAVPEAHPDFGVRLTGLRRCVSTDGNVAHILYDHGGRTISVFAAGEGSALYNPGMHTALDPAGRARGAAIETFEALGQKAIVFTSGPETYVAVGRDPDLERIALSMSENLARRRSGIR